MFNSFLTFGYEKAFILLKFGGFKKVVYAGVPKNFSINLLC